MPSVSVIIPAYNVGPYLRQCLDSITEQTLYNIEIILVDDGSTDDTCAICYEYAVKDSRIKLIRKANGGLSSARNDGIAASTAPYIMFLDGDDWAEPDFCEKAYNAAGSNNADIILFTYNKVFNDGSVTRIELPFQPGPIGEKEALYYNVRFSAAAWLGLYRKDLFNNVCFPDGKIHEDSGTTHRLIHAAKTIYLINNALYNYRIGRPGSIVTEKKFHPDLCEMRTRRIKDLCEWGYEEYSMDDILFLAVRFGKYDKFAELLKKNHMKGLSWTRKMMALLFRLSPALFDTVCIVTGRRVK